MRSKRLLGGVWIAAAGACLALGAGNGVAAADEADSSDGASHTASAAAEPAEAAQGSQAVADDGLAVPKGIVSGFDSADGPTKVDTSDKPLTKVSAATVTVHRDRDVPPADPSRVAAESVEPSVSSNKPASQTSASDGATPVVTPKPATTEEAGPVAKAAGSAKTAQPVATVASTSTPAAPVARPAPTPPAGPLATVVISLLSAFGLLPPGPPVPVTAVGVAPGPSSNAGVTGVVVGRSNVQVPVNSATYTAAADWYFPTQADGTVQAQGVTWLQHGFLGSRSWYSALAQQLAQQTNSVVVVPNVPSFSFFTCGGCSLSDVAMQQGIGALFADPSRTSLNLSAAAAGYQGTLPETFVLTGHSAGGGLAAAAGGFYSATVSPANDHLRGVVMYDGVSSNGTFANAVDVLGARGIPLYQIAAPPQSWNANGQTTTDLVALRPDQFVGALLADGSHVDSLIGGSPVIDFLSQLLIKPSPAGNTQAVYALATGWINDMYAGRGPADPLYGSYGDPGQYVVLGRATAVVLGSPPAGGVVARVHQSERRIGATVDTKHRPIP